MSARSSEGCIVNDWGLADIGRIICMPALCYVFHAWSSVSYTAPLLSECSLQLRRAAAPDRQCYGFSNCHRVSLHDCGILAQLWFSGGLWSPVFPGPATDTLLHFRSNWRRQAVQGPEGPSPAPPSKQTSSSAVGTCLPYLGQVCAPYRTSGDAVFVAWPDTAAIVEERVRAALSVISNSPDLTQVS